MTDEKRRHGCLTAWLISMIVLNALFVVAIFVADYLRLPEDVATPTEPNWALSARCWAALLNIAGAVALFRWKRWGFWAACLSSAIVVVALGLESDAATASFGLIGIVILYLVLQIGKENKGWTQLD